MDKLQLQHPQGKKAISMSKEKYDAIKQALLQFLKGREASFAEIENAVADHFKKNKIKFEGSLPWHLEWVKLDLEAKAIIQRVPKASPVRYVLSN
jgi:hypothetical protein